MKTLAIFRIESIPNKKAQKLFLEPENSCSYHIFSSETIIYKKTPPEIPLCLPREDTNNDFRTIWYLHKKFKQPFRGVPRKGCSENMQ